MIDIGRPWKGGRLFRNNAVGKDMELIEQFGQFAKADSLMNCYFWNVSLTGCKANVTTLIADVERFNSDINQHFSELRKKHRFELLVLALHFRYDEHQNAIDLHAHFVCRVPPEALSAVQLYIRINFSLPYVESAAIENAEAVLNYMLFGIFDNWEMIEWPDETLAAVWEMTQHKRYRYVRTGGAFAKWRKAARAANDNSTSRVATPSKPAFVLPPGHSRFLARVTAKVRGRRVAALLYERPLNHQDCPSHAPAEYSTASRGTTQEPFKPETAASGILPEPSARKSLLLERARTVALRFCSKIFSKMTQLKTRLALRLRE